jgi:hypothetical protein
LRAPVRDRVQGTTSPDMSLGRPFAHGLQAYQLMRLPWMGPRLDLRLVLAYARRFHRLRDKMRETWEHNRGERARAAFHA